MTSIIRNFIALLLGVVVGGAVNMGLIIAGPSLIPPPAGVDVTDAESIAASIHLFEPVHFVVPFMAHALGTLTGAVIAYVLASSYAFTLAVVVGVLFLFGGILNSLMIPAPTWFIVFDLVAAYVPMSVIGILIGRKVAG